MLFSWWKRIARKSQFLPKRQRPNSENHLNQTIMFSFQPLIFGCAYICKKQPPGWRFESQKMPSNPQGVKKKKTSILSSRKSYTNLPDHRGVWGLTCGPPFRDCPCSTEKMVFKKLGIKTNAPGMKTQLSRIQKTWIVSLLQMDTYICTSTM